MTLRELINKSTDDALENLSSNEVESLTSSERLDYPLTIKHRGEGMNLMDVSVDIKNRIIKLEVL